MPDTSCQCSSDESVIFSFDCGRSKNARVPEFALVLGSGASVLDVHEHRERLRALAQEDILVFGVNYSYRVYITLQHVFLDWEMWAQNFYDLNILQNEFNTTMFAPIGFSKERVENTRCCPLPANVLRFGAFICAAMPCPHNVTKKGKLKEHLSDHIAKGLRGSATSVMPAINMAYLTGAKTVAIIGVEMDTARHFWQDERWKTLKDEMPHKDKWQGLTLDLWGAPPEHKFPNADYNLSDLKDVGKWLKKKGVRPLNLAVNPPGAVKGWDRMSLDELLTETERKIAKRKYQREYRKRERKVAP